MRTLTYYTSSVDDISDQLPADIKALCQIKNIAFLKQNIDGEKDLERRFSGFTPCVIIGPFRLTYPFTTKEIEVAIDATLDLDKSNLEADLPPTRKSNEFSKLEAFSLWLSKSYAWVISFIIILFVAIPFYAPVLEASNHKGTANVIYKVYHLFCHQLAFRSYFLDGIQFYYPRELAHIDNILTYEKVTGMPADDLQYARNFRGTPELGYKVAFCERDVAIYLSIGLFGLFFQLTGKKIKAIPWYLWIAFALLPIAIDGFSQLPGLASGWPAWLPVRESTPLLRTITGALFGGGTAWYMYPLMEESMTETRFQLSRKKRVLENLKEKTIA